GTFHDSQQCTRVEPMLEPYESLAVEIRKHGFYSTSLETMGEWDRLTICSARRPGDGYTGNSFWLTYLSESFYLGTWGGSLYRLPDGSQISKLCVEWLRHQPKETKADFDDALKTKYGLIETSDFDFDDLAGNTADQD